MGDKIQDKCVEVNDSALPAGDGSNCGIQVDSESFQRWFTTAPRPSDAERKRRIDSVLDHLEAAAG